MDEFLVQISIEEIFMNIYRAYYLFSSYAVTNVGKPKTRVVYTPGYTTFVIELICS